MIWRCASDFYKVLLKFQMATMDQLQLFVGAKTKKKLKAEVIQILQSNYPRYEDVKVMLKGFTKIQNGRHGWTS